MNKMEFFDIQMKSRMNSLARIIAQLVQFLSFKREKNITCLLKYWILFLVCTNNFYNKTI